MVNNFVIVAQPRTGTTMLCIALDNLDGFNVYGEVLVHKKNHMVIKKHPQEAIEKLRQKNKPKNLYNFLSKKYNFKGDQYSLKKITKKDVYEYLDGLYSEEGIVGFKLLYPHLDRIPSVIDYIKDRNIKVIYLYREDKKKQIVSAFTNQFMHKHDGKKKMKLHDNQIKSIGEAVNDLTNKDVILDKMFPNAVKMSYEEMTGDYNADTINVSKMSKLLSIPEKIKTYTKKYGPKEIKDRVENYKGDLC